MPFERAVLIVLDSLGIGAQPDAELFGDSKADTLGNLLRGHSLKLPNLSWLGIGNISDNLSALQVARPGGCFGRMKQSAQGKDSTSGHWELMGALAREPFPVYPRGFPPELVQQVETVLEQKTLCNLQGDGEEMIAAFAEEHVAGGGPICYTSADSVFQVAAHVEVMPIEKLYNLCVRIRQILVPPHNVSRVIARPFKGEKGAWQRIDYLRRDFSIDPPRPTLLDLMEEKKLPVFAIGKIEDIFNKRGVSFSYYARNMKDGMEKIIELLAVNNSRLVFANFNEFDLRAHRGDAGAYSMALESFDALLPDLLERLCRNDLLILTADHGCDPTLGACGHSREYVPLLVYGPQSRRGENLGTRETLADVSATLAEMFHLPAINGQSFLDSVQ